jgi:hypothetical protein
MSKTKNNFINIDNFNKWFKNTKEGEDRWEQTLFNNYFKLLEENVGKSDPSSLEVSKQIIKEMMSHFGDKVFTMKEDLYIGDPIINMLCEYSHHSELIEWFLEEGGNPNSQNVERATPIQIASDVNKDSVIKILAEKGVDPFVKNNSGFSSIMLLKQWKNKDMINLLVSKNSVPYSKEYIDGMLV